MKAHLDKWLSDKKKWQKKVKGNEETKFTSRVDQASLVWLELVPWQSHGDHSCTLQESLCVGFWSITVSCLLTPQKIRRWISPSFLGFSTWSGTISKVTMGQHCYPPHLVISSDNTPRERKNTYFAESCSSLVQSWCFESVQVEFLQVDHTHKELNQRFTSMCSIVKTDDYIRPPQCGGDA